MSIHDDPTYMMLVDEFKQRFACLRGITGTPQCDLAARLGWTRQQIGQLANGRALPSLTTLYKLAEAMGVSPIKLLPTGNDEWRKELG